MRESSRVDARRLGRVVIHVFMHVDLGAFIYIINLGAKLNPV